MATIFAWSGALRKRGELDGIKELQNFGDQLEAACFDTLNDGIATKEPAGRRALEDRRHPRASGKAIGIKTIRPGVINLRSYCFSYF